MKQTSETPPVLDTGTMFFDFLPAFRADPYAALAELQMLLLQRPLCLGRIAFLQARWGEGDTPFPRPKAGALAPYADALALLAEARLAEGYQEGALTPALLEQFHRLTGDPEALWAAHCWLAAGGPGRVGETAVSMASAATSVTGLTDLAQAVRDQPTRWPDLADRLTPWLLGMLRAAGLEEALAGRFLEFVRARLPELERGQRLGERLPHWLEAFAHQTAPAHGCRAAGLALTTSLLEAAAVQHILGQSLPGETDWARRFRALAREQGVRTLQALLDLPVPADLEAEPVLLNFRCWLSKEADRLLGEGRKEFAPVE